MSKLIKLYPENPNPRQIGKITEILRSGGLVIYPTDTVYALGCDITHPKALERLARLKGIQLAKAKLSFMCSDLSNLSDYAKQIDNATFKMLKCHLPGPFTFLLQGSQNLPKSFKKKKTVGIRIPNNSIALTLVNNLGNPIVCTSIHDEDKIVDYTTDPEILFEKWKNKVDIIIDGGYGGNIPSTIVNLCNPIPEIIRQGKGIFEQI